MAWPTIAVRLGTSATSSALILDDVAEGLLGTGTLGSVQFVDVTADVIESSGVSINRGSTRNAGPYFRYEAGSCQFSLNNLSGNYDPENLGGPHVAAGRTLLAPGLPVRVDATYNGTTFVLFVGTVESWSVAYDEAGLMSTATVTASDPVATLAVANPVESALQGANENAGNRISRVLAQVGWPVDATSLDVGGLETLQATTLSSAAWDEATLAADSAGGFLAADTEGRVIYVDKRRLPRTSEITFDDLGVNLPLAEVETSYDSEQLYNAAKIANVDGAEQSAEDVVSRNRFGLRTFSRADLILATDEQALDAAKFVVGQFADLATRIEGLSTTLGNGAPDSHWLSMLGIDVLTRATVSFRTPDGRTISRDGLVRGVTLAIRVNQWRWSISFAEPPDPNGDFVLGSTDYGVLGVNQLALF